MEFRSYSILYCFGSLQRYKNHARDSIASRLQDEVAVGIGYSIGCETVAVGYVERASFALECGLCIEARGTTPLSAVLHFPYEGIILYVTT